MSHAYEVDENDIFNQSEDSKMWIDIKKHMERKV